MNLSFANLKMESSLAIAGHIPIGLAFTIQVHMRAGHRFFVFVQDLARHNPVGKLESERR